MIYSFKNFLMTRDWVKTFLYFSSFMFWFHLAIGICLITIPTWRETFLDWIVQNNKDYFIDYLNWLLKNGFAESRDSQLDLQMINTNNI